MIEGYSPPKKESKKCVNIKRNALCHCVCLEKNMGLGSWFSTHMHLDDYEIQKSCTKYNVLRGSNLNRTTFPGRTLGLFQTQQTYILKTGTFQEGVKIKK